MLYDASAAVHLQGSLSSQAPLVAAVIDSVESEMALLDQDGTIMAVNQAWRDFAAANGGARDGYVGSHYVMTDNPDVEAGIAALVAGELDVFKQAYPCDGPDGPRWFVMHARRVTWPGRPLIVVTHNDVTALRQLHEAEVAQKEADIRADESAHRRDFLAALLNTVAHEFSTPLTPVKIQVRRLQHAVSDVEREAARAMIERNVDRVQRGLDATTLLVAIETGEHPIKVASVAAAAFGGVLQAIAGEAEVVGDGPAIEIDLETFADGFSRWLATAAFAKQAIKVRYDASDATLTIRSDQDELASSGIGDMLLERIAIGQGGTYHRGPDALTMTMKRVA